MLRTFQEHAIRDVESLDGRWEFVTADDRADRAKLPKTYSRSIHVPSCWEQLPGLEEYRGQGWLRTTFESYGGKAVRLAFGGVSHTADVFVDGKPVGHHYDAFTPFEVVLPELSEGPHELVVQVDNSFGDHSALHIENDYYSYGGITRPVELQHVSPLHIANLFATPVRKGKMWSLEVRCVVRNVGRRVASGLVSVALGDELYELGEVKVAAGKTVDVVETLRKLDVEPWSMETPVLYPMTALLMDADGDLVDDLTDRIGFREVKVKGRKLLLNGESICLQGYNRHEDHPQFGCAFPVEAMVTDLELMRDLGCNFVRTCHYPNDMRFLDLCDEMGFAVWEESHARAVDFDHPKFNEQIEDSTREMVQWHFNRPSILIWGCLNECDSYSKPGRAVHKRVLQQLRDADGSRPVTFASNRGPHDISLDLVDIVSWNRYDGWYGGEPDSVEVEIKRALRWANTDASGAKGKPVMMSEFGAGGIYGHRSRNRAKWTEEYQAELLDEQLRVYLGRSEVVGVAIWQFCDVRLTRDWWGGRPRTMNNKGTVDEYRRPKLCYDTVKRRFTDARAKRG